MAYARQMLDSYRRSVDIDPDTVAAAIEALDDCAQACTADVDANLSEPNVDEMVRCIRLCLQCTDICSTAGAVSSRLGDCEADVIRPLIEACVAACEACGAECERHGHMHEHCRICAEACRRCEQACRRLLAALN
jgi:hypothetical protein